MTNNVEYSFVTRKERRKNALKQKNKLNIFSVTGELFVFSGFIVGLFVVWQLFYTDVQSTRTQDELLNTLDWVELAHAQNDTINTENNDETILINDGVLPDEYKNTGFDSPVIDTPKFKETFATLSVPRWGPDYIKPITSGVTRKDVLDPLGIGHYPETQLPGELGNFAISAHRTTYGKPFNKIHELKTGDALVVQTEDAWFIYKVTESYIVKPTDVQVLAQKPNHPNSEPDDRYITLTTCHPLYSAAERWVVHGVMEYWAPTGHGTPKELI